MRLLLDQNISYKVVSAIIDLFPESRHVRSLGFDSSGDEVIWSYAITNNFVIVSKDSDFYYRTLVQSESPKIIWINKGNCSTENIVDILRKSQNQISNFIIKDISSKVLILS